MSIERYDQNPELEFFHGNLGKVTYQQLQALTKQEVGEHIARLIGHEHHSQRMLDSLSEIGKTLVSWPQLGGAALLNGTAVAYCVRKIVCGQSVVDGRIFVSLDKIFHSEYTSEG